MFLILSTWPARYQQEFDGERSTRLAQRIYYEAFHINPELGESKIWIKILNLILIKGLLEPAHSCNNNNNIKQSND